MKTTLKKLKEYLSRYWLAELISYILAIWWWTIVYYMTGDKVLSTVCIVFWDIIWYYWVMFLKELQQCINRSKSDLMTSISKSIWLLSLEFWWPQLTEIFVIYPILIYYIPQFFENYSVWIFVAMTITVFIFYMQTIFLYELKKKYFLK